MLQNKQTNLVTLLLFFVGNCLAQGFINLNFEAANVSGYSPGDMNVPTNAAIPGWTAHYFQSGQGVQPAAEIWYDTLSIGGAVISVNDSNTSPSFAPLQGKFSVLLFGAVFERSATISQRGLVPTSTQSLRMQISTDGYTLPIGQFIVTLDGQVISMVPLATFPAYTLFGGDISSFENQPATLEITAAGVPPGELGNPIELDDIVFSSQPIPEPTEISLLGLGMLALMNFRASTYRKK
jgi:hypothetical protein